MYDQWINMHKMGLQNTLDAKQKRRTERVEKKKNHFTQACCLSLKIIFQNKLLI